MSGHEVFQRNGFNLLLAGEVKALSEALWIVSQSVNLSWI
jgi:hypothetical protein